MAKMTDKQAAALKKAQEASAAKRAQKSNPIPEPEKCATISEPEKCTPVLNEDRSELIAKLDKIIEIQTAILESLKQDSTSKKIDMSKLVK